MLARRARLFSEISGNGLQLLHGDIAPFQPRLFGEAVGIIQHAPPETEERKHRRRDGKDRHPRAVSLHPPPPDELHDQKDEQHDAERRKKEDDPLRHGKRHGGKEPSRKGVPRAHERFVKKVHHRPVFAQQKVRREPRERNEQHRMARRTQPPERPERYFLFLRCFHIWHFTPSDTG